jgi:hypothetical protein
VKWVFSRQDVADAAEKLFVDEGLNIKVEVEKQTW